MTKRWSSVRSDLGVSKREASKVARSLSDEEVKAFMDMTIRRQIEAVEDEIRLGRRIVRGEALE